MADLSNNEIGLLIKALKNLSIEQMERFHSEHGSGVYPVQLIKKLERIRHDNV